jgi:hypothetical protein
MTERNEKMKIFISVRQSFFPDLYLSVIILVSSIFNQGRQFCTSACGDSLLRKFKTNIFKIKDKSYLILRHMKFI